MNQVSAHHAESSDRVSVVTPPAGKPHRIVIVGGGAAGLELATRLGDTLGWRAHADVTLVERTGTHLWKPLLHEVAAGVLEPKEHEVEHVAHVRRHHYSYCPGTLVGLDWARRLVQLTAPSGNTPAEDVPYDTLVIAIGSVSNDFGTRGVSEHAIALETSAHAVRFHRRLVDAFHRANFQVGPIEPGQLHVAIFGAGATGTELAAGLHRAAPRQGIKVFTNRRVTEVRADGVKLADGELIASGMVVWAAGVKGPVVLSELDGLEATPRNQLVVNADLSTSRDPNTAAPYLGTSGLVPPRAQAAPQMASHLAKQIGRRLDRRRLMPFRYRDYGALVSLGRHTTVGDLRGPTSERSIFVKGQVAHLMYKSLRKMYEISLHGALDVALKAPARGVCRRLANRLGRSSRF